jgi:hypothetical protein
MKTILLGALAAMVLIAFGVAPSSADPDDTCNQPYHHYHRHHHR